MLGGFHPLRGISEMIERTIAVGLEHLVLGDNGTRAADGWLAPGLGQRPPIVRSAIPVIVFLVGVSVQSAAESGDREGTFYLWTPEEISSRLPPGEAAFILDVYAVTEHGDFDGGDVLHLPTALARYAQRHGQRLPALLARLDANRARLRMVRAKREHPSRDEKIIVAWNGMMITTLALAAEVFDERRYREASLRAARFLWRAQWGPDGRLWRVSLHQRRSIAAKQDFS